MVCASLGRDEEAIAAIEKSLELDLPPALLAPLRWFEQDRPEFYEKHASPLLARSSRLLGRILAVQGEYTQANVYFDRAL